VHGENRTSCTGDPSPRAMLPRLRGEMLTVGGEGSGAVVEDMSLSRLSDSGVAVL
jgi:hypothetical protein